jgi:homoserine O-succinyltransferase/O-acetyltransferase
VLVVSLTSVTNLQNESAPAPRGIGQEPAQGFSASDPNCLEIGIVNNMPDAALNATERQFSALLGSAPGIFVRLTFFAIPEVPRTDFGRQQIDRYSHIDTLWDRDLDGVIITGAEPRAANLADEPYWSTLTRIVDWADDHTHSTVWSCLAAHAALLYLDGIDRRLLSDKRFGVFACDRVSDHPLIATTPYRLEMPHSRWNEISEDELVARGYHVLTRSEDAGVDAFLKQRKSLYVFFQGHPEYEAATLLLEYRRDVGRFLRGERESYPTMPAGYFDPEMVETLVALRERASVDRREELLSEFPTALAATRVTNTWRSTAESLYGNWLLYLREQKRLRRVGSS